MDLGNETILGETIENEKIQFSSSKQTQHHKSDEIEQACKLRDTNTQSFCSHPLSASIVSNSGLFRSKRQALAILSSLSLRLVNLLAWIPSNRLQSNQFLETRHTPSKADGAAPAGTRHRESCAPETTGVIQQPVSGHRPWACIREEGSQQQLP